MPKKIAYGERLGSCLSNKKIRSKLAITETILQCRKCGKLNFSAKMPCTVVCTVKNKIRFLLITREPLIIE